MTTCASGTVRWQAEMALPIMTGSDQSSREAILSTMTCPRGICGPCLALLTPSLTSMQVVRLQVPMGTRIEARSSQIPILHRTLPKAVHDQGCPVVGVVGVPPGVVVDVDLPLKKKKSDPPRNNKMTMTISIFMTLRFFWVCHNANRGRASSFDVDDATGICSNGFRSSLLDELSDDFFWILYT